MPRASKTILTVIITAILVGGGVYLLKKETFPAEWGKIVKYNCEQSGGKFTDNKCECPFEEQLGQTSESMYDKTTGQCQTTNGGPGGELGIAMDQYINLRMELDECKISN